MGSRYQKIDLSCQVRKARALLEAGTPIVIFDLETTGTNKSKDKIISIHASKCRRENGLLIEGESIGYLINPKLPIPKAASDIHHITDDMVVGCPSEEDIFDKIRNFFTSSPFICGYNVAFDIGFMENMYKHQNTRFEPVEVLDVFSMAKEKLDLKSYSLQSVAEEMGVDIGLTFHSSSDDVTAIARVLKMLLKMYENEPESTNPIILKPESCNYWYRNHTLERIYVKHNPYFYKKTFYDIYRKIWRSEVDSADLKQLEQDCLLMMDAQDIKDFVKKTKELAYGKDYNESQRI